MVGTAGHIDHGKSALVRALTGTDPDRLKEEKERGITIDLGFAHADLGEGVVASFIDVPGHERFVRNMLAGAFGIEAVALVVAADESVMPQTREHFHICRLLGIPRGIVVLTKCDAADGDSQALAEMEARELVRGSFLEGRPVLRVSAKTGQGLAELRAALLGLASQAPPRETTGLLRLPVDRVFTLRGFGTVVTGTVTGGVLAEGDEVEILPSGRRVRVRGLQVHGEKAARVQAGTRAAVNLAAVEVNDIARGEVLTHPATLAPTSMIDAELTLLPGDMSESGGAGRAKGGARLSGASADAGTKPLRDQARVRVHLASAEVLARVRILEGQRLEPGGSALVQLRLERPAVAGRGDILVVRAYSPAATIGGARVLDPRPPKRRGALALDLARALRPADSSLGQVAHFLLEDARSHGLSPSALASRLAVPQAAVHAALRGQATALALGEGPTLYVSRAALPAVAAAVRDALGRFHREHPLRAGMPREELRKRLSGGVAEPVLAWSLSAMVEDGQLRVTADTAALAAHVVTLAPRDLEAQTALLEAALAAGLQGVELKPFAQARHLEAKPLEGIARLLIEAGGLGRVGEGMLVHRDHLEELKRRVRGRWRSGQALDVAGFKEMTGLTRKHVIPLLEYLDRERVTRRVGADRTVL